LLFEIDDTLNPALVTGRAGVSLVIELFRQLGVAAVVDTQVPVTQRQRGLRAGGCVPPWVTRWLAYETLPRGR
jgi:hypothetical protein